MHPLSKLLRRFTYLDDEVLKSGAVLGRVTSVALFDFLQGEQLQLVDALSALFHLLQAEGIARLRSFLSVLTLHLLNIILMLLMSLLELELEEALRVLLTLPLALEHDLEGALVRILPHHPLQLERVAVQLHDLLLID